MLEDFAIGALSALMAVVPSAETTLRLHELQITKHCVDKCRGYAFDRGLQIILNPESGHVTRVKLSFVSGSEQVDDASGSEILLEQIQRCAWD
ncbi:hypothetical protein HDU82_005985 [Entophlyctis luteolus]|nr:hypothetical protein HDU82_005985 [Entophlyctis luteolus]